MVLPSLRGALGDWVYYSTLMSAQQIAEWIEPAKDIRENEKLDEVLQRDLKERKKQIAKYLLTDKSRFFNSIIVGVWGGLPDWAEFDLSKAKDIFENSEQIKVVKESIGLLIFNGDEKMFAVDGQHRAAGIKIASLDNKKEILNEDQFSVIFIAHNDDSLGKKRTRKLFSDINKKAKPVQEGDKIIIDEEEICPIVTRRIYAEYPLFNNGSLIDLTEKAELEKGDITHFTNLIGLNKTHKTLKKLFKKAKNTNEYDEVNVIAFKQIVLNYYDFVFNSVNDYKNFFVEKTLSLKDAREDNKYILFRPIGLSLITKLYVHYNSVAQLEFFKKISTK